METDGGPGGCRQARHGVGRRRPRRVLEADGFLEVEVSPLREAGEVGLQPRRPEEVAPCPGWVGVPTCDSLRTWRGRWSEGRVMGWNSGRGGSRESVGDRVADGLWSLANVDRRS